MGAAVVVAALVVAGGCGGDGGGPTAEEQAAELLGAPPGLGAEGEAAAADDPACDLLTVEEVGDAVGGAVTVRSRAQDGEVGPCQYVGAATVNVLRNDPAEGAAGAAEWFADAEERAQGFDAYVGVADLGDDAFADGGSGPVHRVVVLVGDTAFQLEAVQEPGVLRDLAATAVDNATG